MYALRVRINDQEPTIAGADDLSVLNAIVGCVGKRGEKTHSHRENEDADLYLSVGGLTSRPPDIADEHVHWLSQLPLKIGDVISVEILTTSTADAPVGGKEAEKAKHDEREYFELCKRTYLELREKYEG